jgi:hypothetical protein
MRADLGRRGKREVESGGRWVVVVEVVVVVGVGCR